MFQHTMKHRESTRDHNEDMKEKHALSASAALLAEPARAAMLVALLDGRALTAGELARAAEVSAQSASLHLSKLTDGGMVEVHPQGRHRYYRIAGAEVGYVIEALGVIATTAPPRKLTGTPRDEAMCFARKCYDHLAGRLAVDLAGVMEREGVLVCKEERDYALGPHAEDWLAQLGIAACPSQTHTRQFARRCLDWTERRPHVAGALGANLLQTFLEREWIKPRTDTRAVRVTEAGMRWFTRIGVSVVTENSAAR